MRLRVRTSGVNGSDLGRVVWDCEVQVKIVALTVSGCSMNRTQRTVGLTRGTSPSSSLSDELPSPYLLFPFGVA